MRGLSFTQIALLDLELCFLLVTMTPSEFKSIHCTLQEIHRSEGRLDLVLVREWSGNHEQDENKIFTEPKDISVDKDGNLYILDANRIQVFDKTGNYLHTIGKTGRGPGDLFDPASLKIDGKNDLVVCDGGNRRIEILSSQGDYLGSFSLSENLPGLIALTQRGEILLANRTLTTNPSSSWICYDYHGQILRERGKREGASSVWENNMLNEFAFVLDGNDYLYAAAIYSPVIWKYSPTDVPTMKIDFEVPFVVPDVKSFRRPEGVFVEAEAVSRDLDVDTKGRIFLLSLTRLKNTEERKVGWTISAVSRDGRTAISHKMKFDVNPEDADLYQILVFDASGKILGSAKLNTYADRIKLFGDKLFIIDRFVGVKIYEYKISVK